MPATNPRLSITVKPSVDAILARLSELTGQSKSSFVAEILESSVPVFERMATVIAAAQQAKDSLKAQSVKDLESAEQKLHEMLGVTLDIFDESFLPIVEQAEEIKRRKVTPAQLAAKYGVTGEERPAGREKPARSVAAEGITGRPATAAVPALRGQRAGTSAGRPPHVTRGSGTPQKPKTAHKKSK